MKIIINKIKAGIFIVILFAANSCTELYDTSYSEVLNDGFEPTEKDVDAIIAAGYEGWRKVLLLWNGYWRAQENCADQVITPHRPNGWEDGGIYYRMHRHTWTSDDDIVYQTWSRAYSTIADCNRIIYLIESGELDLTENVRETVAEIKALRASYYYVLCDMYGNVPIDTSYNVEEGYLPQQSNRTEVFNFVVSELTSSLEYLSEETGGNYYGRFNKWAAYTLLAKMYLNAEVYTGTPQWDKCIEQCDHVINSGKFLLETEQKNVFITENQNSAEIIYGIYIDEAYSVNDEGDPEWNAFDIHMQTLQPANQQTYNLTQTPWGGMCAIPQFIDTFDPEDKRLTENFIMGQQFDANGDTLYGTLGSTSGKPLAYINEILPIEDINQEYHGYRFGKFEIAPKSTNILSNDFPLLRYADVLMMKAECLLRTEDANGAAELVTQVRRRAFDDEAKALVTGEELSDESTYNYGLHDEGYYGETEEGGGNIDYGRFLDELGWEFNQEGRRRQDMIRFGVFTTKSFASHPVKIDNHTSLYPIPLNALQTNSNLEQNTGY